MVSKKSRYAMTKMMKSTADSQNSKSSMAGTMMNSVNWKTGLTTSPMSAKTSCRSKTGSCHRRLHAQTHQRKSEHS
jgi:hypothetical protein